MTIKRALLLLVAICLIFTSSFTSLTLAAGETSLGAEQTLTGTISTAGGENWYVINVSQAGTYKIYTSSNGTTFDTTLDLYDHTKTTHLKYDDDGGTPPYSQISYDLAKNTNYYVKVKCYYSDKTGSYKITLTQNTGFLLETGATSFASFYGGDLNPSDVDSFHNGMTAKGWSYYVAPNNNHYGMISDMIGAKDYNVLYWSGHGLSNGIMSFYDSRSTSGYNSYDNSWNRTHGKPDNNTPMHQYVKNTYLYYGQNGWYYTDSQWNNKLNWVILAACNQLYTGTNRNEWAKTMCAQHRVKGLMGYEVTTEDAPLDVNVVNKFIDLAFNSSSKRTLFAWIQANAAYGKNGASCIYHTINEGDTLTDITANSYTRQPVFKYMYLRDGFTGTNASSPFASNNYSSKYLFASTEPLPLLTLSTPKFEVPVTVESEVIFESEDKVSLVDDKVVKAKFKDLKYKIDDEKDVVDKVTKYLKGKELPDDAKINKVTVIVKEDLNEFDTNAPKNEKVAGYMLQYRHDFNGLKISSTHVGDYVNVYVDNEGIFSIEKKWSNTVKNISTKSAKNPNLISTDIAKEKATQYLEQSASKLDKELRNIKDVGLVYVRTGENDKTFVPAWEVNFDNKLGYFHINAITGEIIK